MGSTKIVLLLTLIFLTGSCLGQDVNCTEGDLRLYNKSKSVPDQGMLQRCDAYNQWEAVCNYAWDCTNALVACRQLGFNDSRPVLLGDGYFGKWDSMVNYYYSCSSEFYDSLQDCGTTENGNCYIASYPNRMAGLACHSPLGGCTHGDLRLMGGESESEGLVEVCYKGGWYAVCDIEDHEASVMCKQLGHTEYPESVVFNDGRFGKAPPSQGYIYLTCSPSTLDDKWIDCTVASPSCSSCDGDAIKCFTPPECDEGSLRLVDGIIDNEGRVEVCLQGVWGIICSYKGWDVIDGYVACKQINLGTSGKAPTIYIYSSMFGDGNQRQVMYYPNCQGWENTLTACSYSSSFTCSSRSYTAGILCFDDCKDGEVRLVGGASDSEGTVEVCIEKLWGLVGESGWSLTDAQVVCRQLGFPIDDVQAVNKSRYGKPRKPVHWGNMNCNGKEQQILSCERHDFTTLDDKKTILSHINVAGVKCQPTTSLTPTTMNETNGSGSAGSNGEAPAVLVAPTYLTMLMVIANLALSIVIVGKFLLRREPSNAKEVSKENSFPMTSRDSYASRYTVAQQRHTLPASSYPPTATSHHPTASAPHHHTKAATSHPTKVAPSQPATVVPPPTNTTTLPGLTTDVPPPLPQARSQAGDETEPMYEFTDVAMENYTDMA